MSKPAGSKHRVGCDCHHPLHFLEIDHLVWGEGDEDISAYLVAGRTTFWRRVQNALGYVFKGTDVLVTGDIVLSPQACADLAEYLNSLPPVQRLKAAQEEGQAA